MKIVINKCFGGFGLSEKAKEILGIDNSFDEYQIDRNDPKLIEVVETLGDEANGHYARLRIVNIPDDATDWELDEYDGAEKVLFVVNGKIGRA